MSFGQLSLSACHEAFVLIENEIATKTDAMTLDDSTVATSEATHDEWTLEPSTDCYQSLDSWVSTQVFATLQARTLVDRNGRNFGYGPRVYPMSSHQGAPHKISRDVEAARNGSRQWTHITDSAECRAGAERRCIQPPNVRDAIR